MLYFSTADPRHRVSLAEAIRRGLPPDGGFYMPERLPLIPGAFFRNMADMSLKDIGYVVANTLFGEDIPSATLQKIVADAIDFDTPLRPDPELSNTWALELFHGPSRSYKDFGARFMAHLFRALHLDGKELNIVVATTGDAGEAVAHAFHGMPGVRVFILYPRTGTGVNRLSSFASMGGNIIPVEVRGTFSQCHDMVKSAFADRALASRLNLFAANSFNLARLLPQTIYYFYAFARLMREDADTSRLVISVPTGNLGNLTAGLIAKQMGLPAARFIAAREEGSEDFFDALVNHHRLPTRLDAPGVPPNLWRLLSLYNGNINLLGLDAASIVVGSSECKDMTAMTRAAIASPAAADATARIYFATTDPAKRSEAINHHAPSHSHHPLHPATVLTPSPAVFRQFLLSHH